MTTRRDFFKLALGAAALTAIPAPVTAAPIPTIYADGVHCDAAGLRALASGEAVEILRPDVLAGTGWRDGRLHLKGDFSVREPFAIEDTDVHFGGCSFSRLSGFPDDECVLSINGGTAILDGPISTDDNMVVFGSGWRISFEQAEFISLPPSSLWGWGDDGRPLAPPKPPKKPKALRGRV